MLLFGSLCIYVMAYGAASLFSGIAVGLSHDVIKKGIESVTEAVKEVSQEDFGLRPEEGLLSIKHVFLFEACPILETYQGGVLRKMAHSRLDLTEGEIHTLGAHVDALNTFLAFTDQEAVTDEFIIVQLDMLIRPIVNFVASIPPTRIEAPHEKKSRD